MTAKIVTVIVVLLLAASASRADNLLSNPGFEDYPIGLTYGDGQLQDYGWRYWSVVGAGSMEIVSPGLDGARAMKLTSLATNGEIGIDKNPVTEMAVVTPGHRYRGSVWARSDNGAVLQVALVTCDQNGGWIGIAALRRFPLSTQWREFVLECIAPSVPRFCFDMRVVTVGNAVIDRTELIDLSTYSAVPDVRITYPVNEIVDHLKPAIAFMGSSHDAFQVIISDGENVVWDSGTVTSTAYTLACPNTLQPQTAYSVRVRLRNAAGWGDYSPATTFTTPAAPVVKLLSPEEADSLRGPTATVKWKAEAPGEIISQTLSLDGGSPIPVTRGVIAPGVSTYGLTGLSEGMHTVSVTVTSAEGTAIDTARFYVRLTPAPTGTIYFYDLSWIHNYINSDIQQAKTKYDILMAVSALQGLVNRSGPRLYVKIFSSDTTWWNRLRESGNWLSNLDVVTLPTGIENLVTLFDTFKDDYQGAVVWDYNVFSTANVACSVAGADDLIPICYDATPGSVYQRLVQNGPHLPVLVDLVAKFTGTGTIWDTSIPSTGSTKNDAYIWARVKYLETGKCNPSLLMWAIDAYWTIANYWNSPELGNMVPNRDYMVQHKGFVFDLSVWADQAPVDDPGQAPGTDLSTHVSILAAAAARAPGMIHGIGFVPWWAKYNTGDAEFETTRWWTAYNVYQDGDAPHMVDLPNASILGQFPLPDRLTQNRKQSFTEYRKKGYVDVEHNVAPINFLAFYAADYDSACWLTRLATGLWGESKRGTIPVSWGFNPNLIERAAAAYEYYNRTRSDLDSFVAGDCGSGYVNPTRLIGTRESGLPSAHDVWVAHNLKYYRLTNTKITGFILNGSAGHITSETEQMYAEFSPDGSFSEPYWWPQTEHLVGSMPALILDHDLSYTLSTAINNVYNLGYHTGTRFLSFRAIRQGPNTFSSVYNGVVARNAAVPWSVVDMRAYSDLNSCYIGRVPDNRATYTFDVVPRSFEQLAAFAGTIGIRNDGWVDWDSSCSLMLTWKQGTQVVKREFIPLPRPVPSGSGIVVDFTGSAPQQAGSYTLCYEVARNGIGFSQLGDYNWELPVIVGLSADLNSPAAAKEQPDGTEVTLWDAVVTAGNDQLSGMCYVEDVDRVCGIKVDTRFSPGINVSEGDRVRISGLVAGSLSSERVITSPVLLGREGGIPLEPLAVRCGSIGGGALNPHTPGILGMSGLNNLGLLVKTWGRVTYVNTASKYFFLDDGSGPTDYYGHKGVYIRCGGLASGDPIPLPAPGDYVSVTGIVFGATIAGRPYPAVMVRKAPGFELVLPEQ